MLRRTLLKEAKRAEKLALKEAAKEAKMAKKAAAKEAKMAEKAAAKEAKMAEKAATKEAKMAEKAAAKEARWLKAAAKETKKASVKRATPPMALWQRDNKESISAQVKADTTGDKYMVIVTASGRILRKMYSFALQGTL